MGVGRASCPLALLEASQKLIDYVAGVGNSLADLWILGDFSGHMQASQVMFSLVVPITLKIFNSHIILKLGSRTKSNVIKFDTMPLTHAQ